MNILLKDKKNIILLLAIIIVIIITIAVFSVRKKNVVFYLKGEENVTLTDNQPYNEEYFVALNGYDRDISKYVTISGMVNKDVAGLYQIYYELDYDGVIQTLVRNVMVTTSKEDLIGLFLNGEEDVYISLNSEYYENGAYLYDLVNEVSIPMEPNITSNVDVNNVGVYTVNYDIKYGDIYKTISRKVHVYDIPYYLSNEETTMDNVTINLNPSIIDNYSYTILPDKSIEVNQDVSYVVSENGVYDFAVYDTSNNVFYKSVLIDNIVGSYVCNGFVNTNGVSLSVNGDVGKVLSYTWNLDGQIFNDYMSIKKPFGVSNASVNLSFINGNDYTINCSIKDNLIYHFVYDEKRTREYMKCNTYTNKERIELNSKLKKVIEEAGYGTRAGVVAAARFLVGGLNYKIHYQGGGKYPNIGLNIGQSNAWGCRGDVTYGMDCTNFIYWAFKQNGYSKVGVYSTSNTYPVTSVMDKIKVGDFLLSPGKGYNAEFVHVGIIIGDDGDYFYVAEARIETDSIDITKWNKHNWSSSRKFSVVRLFNYRQDGNLTNMWIS